MPERRFVGVLGGCGICLVMGCGEASDSESGNGAPDSGMPVPDSGRPDQGAPEVEPPPPAKGAGTFQRITLHREFYCEGASFGDIDGDGVTDVVAGPHWYAGPDFTEAHEMWAPQVFDVHAYSNCFFQWTRDLDGDGLLDVLMVRFPGKDAHAWLENPGPGGGHWMAHPVSDSVDDESPWFTDLTGDGQPELVYAYGGALGWAAPAASPTARWVFHPVTANRGYAPFTHGLGVGDVDGDGRRDVIEATGWFRQPASLAGDPTWERHDADFGNPGGAQIFVYDVDGDGDADVVSALEAHGYGISWFEQTSPGAFVERPIVPREPPTSNDAVVIHEPHALAMVDVDGDGVRDLVAGERFYGHAPPGPPNLELPARIYWFELERTEGGPRWTPHLIDDQSGVGTQLTTGDVTGDGVIDIVISNKKGAFVLVQDPG